MGTTRSSGYCALLLLTAAGCYPGPGAAPLAMPVRTVEVLELHAEPVVDSVRLIGRIEAWRETTLYFEVTGIVESVMVEEGDLVEAGQPIAKLVPTDYQLAASRAMAERDASEAQLNLLLAGTRKEDLQAAEADHERAKVKAAFWVSELKRNIELVEKGVVTASVFEQIQSEHDATQQEQLATKARLARAIAGPRTQKIDAAKAELRAYEQTVAIADRQLEKAALAAPIGGRVEKRFLDDGAYVNVFPAGGVPVVHLVDLNQVDAVIAVPEALQQQLVGTTSVEIVSSVHPNIRSPGETVSLGRVADPATGTYEWRIRIPNAKGDFTAGMVVTAMTNSQTSHPAMRVPITAVLHAYGQPPYVLVIDNDDRVVARQVSLGAMHAEQVEIIEGLSDGELLIVRGQHHVVDGDSVQHRPVSLPAETDDARPAP